MTDPRGTALHLADPGEALRRDGVVYADYQSAKPVDPRVVAAMLPYLTEKFGNAASLHGVGDVATAALEEARGRVAAFFGAEPARDRLHRRAPPRPATWRSSATPCATSARATT